MPAYIIVDITVTDSVGYEEYKKLAAPTVTLYGGKYIVRGSPIEVLEGDWSPKRLVILEFENVAQAKKWWSSPEYSKAKNLRHAAAKSKMIAVETV